MTQNKQQERCSSTKQDLNPVQTKRLNNKRIYEATTRAGGLLRLIIPIPIKKFSKKMRNYLFQRVSEKR